MRVNVLAGLTNGEWDHDSCEATVSTKDADHATIMREQLMGYRKQRFAALFCAAAVIILGGCGDDLTQQVYIPGREDLAQPIGGYNATTQAGQKILLRGHRQGRLPVERTQQHRDLAMTPVI